MLLFCSYSLDIIATLTEMGRALGSRAQSLYS